MDLPTLDLLKAPKLKRMTLDVPTADVPSYKPMSVPPSDLRRPDGKPAIQPVQPQVRQINVPIIPKPVPLPSTDIVITAVTTAIAAVAATTAVQPFFDAIKKRVQKFLQKKINKWKENRQKRKDSLLNSKRT